MTYKETLDYMFSKLPMYQRIGAAAYKANLDNTIALDNYFCNPHKHFKTIHIAGTNGKGSVSNMLASILQESGYTVGLYTSPHLLDFRERIRVNGDMISETAVVNFIEKNNLILDQIQPSFFEMTVAMAFSYFAEMNVDIAVIETGLGGRLDSTNIINPLLSIITNISFDHTALLGNTIEKIAIEKAGIIKKNVPVVVGRTQVETQNVFNNKALDNNSALFYADSNFTIKKFEGNFIIHSLQNNKDYNVYLDLFGDYQQENLLTVIQSVEILQSTTDFVITEKSIYDGLRNIKKNTGFSGRWQVLKNKPLTVCDTGHNIDGINTIVAQINKQRFKTLHFIIGTVNDKNIDDILAVLPKKAQYYFTNANISRALNKEILASKAKEHFLNGEICNSVKEAYFLASKNATNDDMIFIGGSTFVVAEILDL